MENMLKTVKSLVAAATAVLLLSATMVFAGGNTVGFNKGFVPVVATGTTDSNGVVTVYLATSGVGNTLTDIVTGISGSIVSTNNGVLNNSVLGVGGVTVKNAGLIITNYSNYLTNIVTGISSPGPVAVVVTNISTLCNSEVVSVRSNAVTVLAYLTNVTTSNQVVSSVVVSQTTGAITNLTRPVFASVTNLTDPVVTTFTNAFNNITNVLSAITGYSTTNINSVIAGYSVTNITPVVTSITSSNYISNQTFTTHVPVASTAVTIVIPVAVAK